MLGFAENGRGSRVGFAYVTRICLSFVSRIVTCALSNSKRAEREAGAVKVEFPLMRRNERRDIAKESRSTSYFHEECLIGRGKENSGCPEILIAAPIDR
jgi:hypothetical protein